MNQRVNVINQKRAVVEGPNRVRIVRVGNRGVPASVSAASYWTAVAEGGLSAENAVATLAPGDHVVAHTDGVPRNATLSDLLAAIGSQNQNLVMASPNGSSGAVSLRALVDGDIPSLPASKITSGEFNVARIPNLTLSKITDAGTMASQAANNVAITGGAASGLTSLGVTGNTTLGDVAADTLTINGTAVSIPNNLNFDSNTLFINASNNRVGVNNASPSYDLDVTGAIRASTILHTTSLRGSATGIGQIGLTGSTTNLITLLPENATQRTLNIRGFTSHSATLTEWQDSGQNILSQVAANGAITSGVRDAGTNDTVRALTVRRNSTGTPAANFATGIDFLLENASQVENRRAASLDILWNTPTNNAEIPDVILSAYYANGTQREAMRIRGDSAATQLSFFGVTPVIRQAMGAWAGLTDAQRITALRDALTNLGLTSYT